MTSHPDSPPDLTPLVVEIAIQNLTSHTQVPAEKCTLEEVEENALVVEVPYPSCQENHHLSLLLKYKRGVHQGQVQVTGRATRVETCEPEGVAPQRQRVSIELIQFDANQWTLWLQVNRAKQDQINEFLRQSKGF
jgi:hypothetical protein